jgi:putative ABC transport system permease protein
MRWQDYLALSIRSLRRSRTRSLLTIGAIVIGATGITIMLTFVTSVKSYVVDQFTQSGEARQIQVSQSQNLFFHPLGNNGGPTAPGTKIITPNVESLIAKFPHVVGVSASMGQNGGNGIEYVVLGSKKLQPNIVGYQANHVLKLPLQAGRALNSADSSGVVILTSDYANALGFSGSGASAVGKTIYLHTYPGYTGQGASLPSTLPPQVHCTQGQNCRGGPTSGLPALNLPARVVGIVNKSYNSQTIYMPLAWAIGISNQSEPNNISYQSSGNNQGGFGTGFVLGGWRTPSLDAYLVNSNGYQSLTVEVDNSDYLTTIASRIRQLGFGAVTGQSQLTQQTNAANVIGLVLGALGLIALAIAALGVMNTMIMSVLERTREIGVMRALGARRSTIRRLFTFEALVLGFLGGFFGVVIGSVILLFAKPFITRQFPSGTTPSLTVPLWLVVIVIALTTFIGFLSGLLPSRRAARLDPIEALRYE